jgi:hypothetical protein
MTIIVLDVIIIEAGYVLMVIGLCLRVLTGVHAPYALVWIHMHLYGICGVRLMMQLI